MKSWLFNDEFGNWEKRAQACIERTDSKARELGMTEGQQDAEIVVQIQFLAVEAVINQARKDLATRALRQAK